MKSFLLKEKFPICKWGMIPNETYFEGVVPDGYGLAISPHHPYIILDIDQHGTINGFDNIPFSAPASSIHLSALSAENNRADL